MFDRKLTFGSYQTVFAPAVLAQVGELPKSTAKAKKTQEGGGEVFVKVAGGDRDWRALLKKDGEVTGAAAKIRVTLAQNETPEAKQLDGVLALAEQTRLLLPVAKQVEGIDDIIVGHHMKRYTISLRDAGEVLAELKKEDPPAADAVKHAGWALDRYKSLAEDVANPANRGPSKDKIPALADALVAKSDEIRRAMPAA